ncbi:hypothetical protein [Couchioplanes azureus]|uniref:hypothetical protein n=1 Tax=Couchioplanes caeruleus TaxID=56438 RepID=UPI0019C8D326|nr:hypothetical protein [Couchioplanes caeruleus]GGQ84671.1 hypothetical protein GCM10010166_63590 [Couchioplanes caeruleus subsp. azureus]
MFQQAGYERSVTNLAQLTLASDNVFGDDGGATQLGTVTGDVTKGYAVSLAVRVDTRTAPSGGQLSGDGRPSGAPPGPGGSGRPGGSGGPGGMPPRGPPPANP